MDHNSIIDRKTYEVTVHAEDNPYVFVCDKSIAPVIAELNKKGYETLASCSGHYKIEFYEWFDEDIKNLNKYKNDKRIIIKKVNENGFDYWAEVDTTVTYILFNKQYDFDVLPNGFSSYIFDSNRTCIENQIDYYYKNGVKKKRKIVEKEIDENCKKLKEWVDKLPKIERNDYI